MSAAGNLLAGSDEAEHVHDAVVVGGGQVTAVNAVRARGEISGLAIASSILSIGSLLVCGVLAIPGMILGIFALREIKTRRKRGKALAIVGIAVGVCSILLAAIVGYVLLHRR